MGGVRAGMVSLIFPGQGSQYVGMGSSLNSGVRSSATVFRMADEILGFSISDICFNGPPEKLNATEYCQPAVFTVGYACWAALKEYYPDVKVSMFAGHSLGEFTALASAGSLSFADALALVRKRGLIMAEAGKNIKGTMYAVLGMKKEELGEICERSGVCLANINCPGQTVISGKMEDINNVLPLLASRGGKAIPLKVGGAFHSRYMKEGAGKFAGELERVDFKPPAAPVLSNVNAGFHGPPGDIRKALAEQLYSPVLWEDSVLRMVYEGADTFIEAGPGGVLTKLVLRTCPDVRAGLIEDRESLEQTVELLEGKKENKDDVER